MFVLHKYTQTSINTLTCTHTFAVCARQSILVLSLSFASLKHSLAKLCPKEERGERKKPSKEFSFRTASHFQSFLLPNLRQFKMLGLCTFIEYASVFGVWAMNIYYVFIERRLNINSKICNNNTLCAGCFVHNNEYCCKIGYTYNISVYLNCIAICTYCVCSTYIVVAAVAPSRLCLLCIQQRVIQNMITYRKEHFAVQQICAR